MNLTNMLLKQFTRYIIWSKSVVDIKVSNTVKSKNNLEKCMKAGPHTLWDAVV